MALFGLFWAYGALRYHETPFELRFSDLMTGAFSISFCGRRPAFLVGRDVRVVLRGPRRPARLRGRERLRASPSGHVAMLMLTLVLPFLVALVHVAKGWDPADFTARRHRARSARCPPAALALSALVAFAWCAAAARCGLRFRRWLGLAALFWTPPVVL